MHIIYKQEIDQNYEQILRIMNDILQARNWLRHVRHALSADLTAMTNPT